MRVLGFIGANLFLLAILLIGVGTLWACGTLINRLDEPNDWPIAWAAALAISIAAMGVLGRLMHRIISRSISRGRGRAPA